MVVEGGPGEGKTVFMVKTQKSNSDLDKLSLLPFSGKTLDRRRLNNSCQEMILYRMYCIYLGPHRQLLQMPSELESSPRESLSVMSSPTLQLPAIQLALWRTFFASSFSGSGGGTLLRRNLFPTLTSD